MDPGNNSGGNESHQVTSASQEEHSRDHMELPNDLPTELPPEKSSTPGGETLQFKRDKQTNGLNIEFQMFPFVYHIPIHCLVT